jgi:hypothetical protein
VEGCAVTQDLSTQDRLNQGQLHFTDRQAPGIRANVQLHPHGGPADCWLTLEMAAKPAGELLNFVCFLKSRDRNYEVADFFYVLPEFIR